MIKRHNSDRALENTRKLMEIFGGNAATTSITLAVLRLTCSLFKHTKDRATFMLWLSEGQLPEPMHSTRRFPWPITQSHAMSAKSMTSAAQRFSTKLPNSEVA
ncbi:hypothetical protein V1517DRAFT_346045 [Lipomyces orientalis]|uniref:Uncharacterized protein n=1 Tax=Lipomyces orientalis TaxID=1233043 RepID=A0ACC3TNC2_9ASCO